MAGLIGFDPGEAAPPQRDASGLDNFDKGRARPRMVVADDDQSSLDLLRCLLEHWGFSANLAQGGPEAWELLRAQDIPTILLLDWVMPGLNGLELCRRLRSLPRTYYTYVLLITSNNERRHLVEALESGADDFVTKPLNADELHARLQTAERIVGLQRQLVLAKDHLQSQATHDFLTQLLNRAGITEVLERELQRSRRSGEPLCVMMADIDHFKTINDTHGHAAGDRAICKMAGAIQASLRPYDSLGRYGGDEFLIVAPGCDESTALQLAERFRESCKAAAAASDPRQATSLSIGLTCGRGETSGNNMILMADAALYRAKEAGRNRSELTSSTKVEGPERGKSNGTMNSSKSVQQAQVNRPI